MDGIKRTSRSSVAKNASSLNKSRVQKSTTLNRKFVKKPVAVPKVNARSTSTRMASARTSRQASPMLKKQHSVKLGPVAAQSNVVKNTTQKQAAVTVEAAAKVIAERAASSRGDNLVIEPPKEYVREVNARVSARNAEAPVLMSMQEHKDRAIQNALKEMDKSKNDQSEFYFQNKKTSFWRSGKGIAVGAMAAIAIALFGYLTYLNLPDISMRMASAKAGIEKSYPSYVPSGYRLDGTVKESDGKITMAFKNRENAKFMLSEEKSSWDSTAVLNNYVLREWGDDYTIVRGQGLTVYVSGSNAVWVNAGILYKVDGANGALTADELHSIAVSL